MNSISIEYDFSLSGFMIIVYLSKTTLNSSHTKKKCLSPSSHAAQIYNCLCKTKFSLNNFSWTTVLVPVKKFLFRFRLFKNVKIQFRLVSGFQYFKGLRVPEPVFFFFCSVSALTDRQTLNNQSFRIKISWFSR